jgi:G3E family GTPase
VIILNKTDLVGADEVSEIEARIRGINPYAKLHKTVNCSVPLDAVLGRNAFDLDRILEIEPEFLDREGYHDHGDHHREARGLKHYHDQDIQSVSLSIEGDIDPEKFMPWLQNYVQKEGASILGMKGILAFKNEPKRFVFQEVHMLLDGDLQREWKPQEKRVSRLVLIGRNLKKDEITQGFLSCAA